MFQHPSKFESEDLSMETLTTKLRNEIIDEYKKFLSSQSPEGEVSGVKLNTANIVLDILNIYLEKTNET